MLFEKLWPTILKYPYLSVSELCQNCTVDTDCLDVNAECVSNECRCLESHFADECGMCQQGKKIVLLTKCFHPDPVLMCQPGTIHKLYQNSSNYYLISTQII